MISFWQEDTTKQGGEAREEEKKDDFMDCGWGSGSAGGSVVRRVEEEDARPCQGLTGARFIYEDMD